MGGKMPTYLYKCKTCGKEFEYKQSINDEPLTHCPESVCASSNGHRGKGEVFRKIGKNVGFVFNGSGFYLTDYVHKKEKAASCESGSCADSGSSCPAADSNAKAG